MRTSLDAVFAFIAFTMPLAAWPGADHPFSGPKTVLLAVGLALVGVVGAAGRAFHPPALPRGLAIPVIVLAGAAAGSALWGTLVSPAALALQVLGLAWFAAVVSLRPAPRAIATALAASATVVAAIALLQLARLDPFALLGYLADAGNRMRVYGTFGNPNFLAVFLVAVLPLTVATCPPRLGVVAAVLQTAALVATGSRGAVLAALAVGLFLALVPWRGRRLAAAAALLIAGAIVALSAARPVGETVAGRIYIWKVAAPHVMERPLAGFGPGAFEPMWVRWEAQAWKAGTVAGSDRRFAAVQDHAHNEYLETAVDSGVPAALALAVVVIALAAAVRRHADRRLGLAAGCGVVAIAAAALVDFPLHRPAELFLFWVLAGVATSAASACRSARAAP